jgi:hypothetical protein
MAWWVFETRWRQIVSTICRFVIEHCKIWEEVCDIVFAYCFSGTTSATEEKEFNSCCHMHTPLVSAQDGG